MRLPAALLLCCLAGCSAKAPVIHRALVRNATSAPISDISVRNAPGGGGGRVSRILPAAHLDLGFSARELKGKSAVVSWSDRRGPGHRVEVELPRRAPDGATAASFTLVYTIWPDGSVSAALE